MAADRWFVAQLKQELSRWRDGGLVNAEQERAILALYPDAGSKVDVRHRAPAIVIGLAAALLGLGVILFYASNWAGMPPWLKLVQIFAVLILTYGGAFYLLLTDRRHPLAGRGLLLVGMLAYGAAIGLIAQIYHISAHPTTGVLVWAVGVLALSMIVEDRFGYYLAAALAFIWNFWEYATFNNPNYGYIAFPLILFFCFRRIGQRGGLLTSLLAGLFYFFQINFYWLKDEPQAGALAFCFALAPAGVLLAALARLRTRPGTALAANAAGFGGWLLALAPYFLLAWPAQYKTAFFSVDPSARVFLVEYGVLFAAAAALLIFLHKRGARVESLAGALALSLIGFALPFDRQAVFLTALHAALLMGLGGLLYFSHADRDAPQTDRFSAFALTTLALIVKAIGLFGLALATDEYYVAYIVGFLIFATVVFLINQLTGTLLNPGLRDADPQINARFPIMPLNAVVASLGYLFVFAVSFRFEAQASIFKASSEIIAVLVFFLAAAFALYAILIVRGAQRTPMAMSAVLFLTSVFALFIAGPDVPWEVYGVLFNLLLLLFVGVMIYYSVFINSIRLANVAIVAFGVHLAVRFVDVFLDLFSGSALLIVSGLVLFAGGFLLERNRRRLIERIREEQNS